MAKKKLKRIDKKNNIIIMCMTRWSYGKGLEILLDAVSEVIKYNKHIKFIIAGRKLLSWENDYFHYLIMINKKIRKLKKHILSLGWLNNIRRNTIFSIADICINPSFLEYFPYAILEPMVTQTPIISSKLDCVTEILSENSDCLLYDPYNSKELADKIMYLASHPEMRKKMAHNAYIKALRLFQWNTITDMYLDNYNTIHKKYSCSYQSGNLETK